jgi:hypothetical protein
MVFVGSYDGNLYAIDQTSGNLVWSYLTDDKVVSSPAVANGVVYLGSYDRMIYAVGTIQNPEIPNLMPQPIFVLLSILLAIAVLAAITIAIIRVKKHSNKLFVRKF